MEKMIEVIQNHIEKSLHIIGNKLVTDTVKQIRADDKIMSKALFNSIAYVVEDSLNTLIFGSNVPQARYLEQGREAGKMPPVNAIQNWIREKMHRHSDFMGLKRRAAEEEKPLPFVINQASWAIAVKMKRKGSKPYKIISLALSQNEDFIRAEIEKAVASAVAELNA